MSYFNQEFIKFFKELANNNTTEWFNDNRKTYEKEVKKPFAAFVGEMITRIQKHEPEVAIKATDAIIRINKDIRFSKDKTPYNSHVAANISAFGKKDKSYPGFYFQLSPEKVSMFGGAYMTEPATLANIRAYIGSHLKDFAAAYNDKKFVEKYGNIQGEQQKRLPEELKAIATKEPLIANKQFYYSASIEPKIITSPELPEKLMEYYIAGRKLNDFLKQAIKN
jgi:uncharacterized protein (TIGR02453 family)